MLAFGEQGAHSCHVKRVGSAARRTIDDERRGGAMPRPRESDYVHFSPSLMLMELEVRVYRQAERRREALQRSPETNCFE